MGRSTRPRFRPAVRRRRWATTVREGWTAPPGRQQPPIRDAARPGGGTQDETSRGILQVRAFAGSPLRGCRSTAVRPRGASDGSREPTAREAREPANLRTRSQRDTMTALQGASHARLSSKVHGFVCCGVRVCDGRVRPGSDAGRSADSSGDASGDERAGTDCGAHTVSGHGRADFGRRSGRRGSKRRGSSWSRTA